MTSIKVYDLKALSKISPNIFKIKCVLWIKVAATSWETERNGGGGSHLDARYTALHQRWVSMNFTRIHTLQLVTRVLWSTWRSWQDDKKPRLRDNIEWPDANHFDSCSKMRIPSQEQLVRGTRVKYIILFAKVDRVKLTRFCRKQRVDTKQTIASLKGNHFMQQLFYSLCLIITSCRNKVELNTPKQ